MRALITGGHGFVGRHLAQHLVKCGDDVALTYLPHLKESELRGPNKVPVPTQAQTLALDVTDKLAVDQLLSLAKPDVIYHLAALTHVPNAETDIANVMAVNVMGTLNLLEAIAKHSKETRLLFVSSSEVYGEPRLGSLPLTEQSELRPISIYGVSKASADLLAFKYAFREGVNVVRVRPFQHTGPGQTDNFAISSFAKQIAEIKLGKAQPTLKVGNLEVKRDYSDVSDIVRGYREAVLNGKRGSAYNLCSGKSVALTDVVAMLLKLAEVEAEVVVDETRVRTVDVPDLYGSAQKAQKEFGWKPRIELEGTLHSLFAYWIETLSAK